MGPMESAVKSIKHATSHYLQDLDAMSEDQILNSAGGAARCPVDFTYETALVNRRLAARLSETEPPVMPDGDPWLVAPEELRSKAAITAFMKESCEVLLSAAQSIPESESGKLVGSPGREEPAFALAEFASLHIMYHDAQLNFIQALNGDLAVHWSSK